MISLKIKTVSGFGFRVSSFEIDIHTLTASKSSTFNRKSLNPIVNRKLINCKYKGCNTDISMMADVNTSLPTHARRGLG